MMGKCGSALTRIETDGVQAGDILRLVDLCFAAGPC